MTKRGGGSKRDYYDEERLRAIAEIRRALPDILEYGTEDDFVELVKKWRKDIAPEDLADWIKLFRAPFARSADSIDNLARFLDRALKFRVGHSLGFFCRHFRELVQKRIRRRSFLHIRSCH
jgi:hypothetical protein